MEVPLIQPEGDIYGPQLVEMFESGHCVVVILLTSYTNCNWQDRTGQNNQNILGLDQVFVTPNLYPVMVKLKPDLQNQLDLTDL